MAKINNKTQVHYYYCKQNELKENASTILLYIQRIQRYENIENATLVRS